MTTLAAPPAAPRPRSRPQPRWVPADAPDELVVALIERELRLPRAIAHLVASRGHGVPDDARQALLALGYNERETTEAVRQLPPDLTVGESLKAQMAGGGWTGAGAWAKVADGVAPTLVGGSKKHGGPDLGPTRAKRAWAQLGVNAHTIAEDAPGPDHVGMPRLTVRMAATLQGFPADWAIEGRKTTAYRQVGNAFPPPVAKALGEAVACAGHKTPPRPPPPTSRSNPPGPSTPAPTPPAPSAPPPPAP